MNTVMQSLAHPLVVLGRNSLITQPLLDRLSAHSGSIFLVTDLHRCAVAPSVQRPTTGHALAGKPPESRWAKWSAQDQSATHASCPRMAVDLPKESAAPSFIAFQGIQGPLDLGDGTVDVNRRIQALIEPDGMTTLAYGPLHLDRTQKTGMRRHAPWHGRTPCLICCSCFGAICSGFC